MTPEQERKVLMEKVCEAIKRQAENEPTEDEWSPRQETRPAMEQLWENKTTGELEWRAVPYVEIYVEGQGRTREWTDKEGNTRRTFEVRADRLQMLSAKGEVAKTEKTAPSAVQKGSGAFDDFKDDNLLDIVLHLADAKRLLYEVTSSRDDIDPRLRYVVLQADRDTLAEIDKLLAPAGSGAVSDGVSVGAGAGQGGGGHE